MAYSQVPRFVNAAKPMKMASPIKISTPKFSSPKSQPGSALGNAIGKRMAKSKAMGNTY